MGGGSGRVAAAIGLVHGGQDPKGNALELFQRTLCGKFPKHKCARGPTPSVG